MNITTNIIWNFAGQGWLFVVAFVATPFIIHRLDINLYGIYVLISVIIDYFAFLQLGMGSAAIKYIAQYIGQGSTEKIGATFWTGVISHAAMGLTGTLILFAFAPMFMDRFFNVPAGLGQTALFALRAGSVGFLLSMLSGMVSGVIRALGRFDILNIMGVIFATAQTSATVILLFMGMSLEEVVVSNVIVQFLGLLGYWFFAIRLLPILKNPIWDRTEFLLLLKFGGFVTVSSVVGPVLTNVEKIFLTSLRSVSALTYYAVPFSLINRLSIIPSSFIQVLFPAFSFNQGANQQELNRDLHFRSTLYLCMFYIAPLVFLIFYGGDFLALWLDKKFETQSTAILVILGVAGLVNAAAFPSMAVLQGMGKPHLPATFHVIEMLMYIPAGYFLIKSAGGTGASVAWLLRVLVDTVLLHRASCSLLKTGFASFYKKIFSKMLPPLLLLLSLVGGMKIIGYGLIHPLNITVVAVAMFAYFCAVYQWVFDESTRARLRGILGRKK